MKLKVFLAVAVGLIIGFGVRSLRPSKPSVGEQPLHLQLWFREASIPVVQQLISELENMTTKD